MRHGTCALLLMSTAFLAHAAPALGQNSLTLHAGANFSTFGGADAQSPGTHTGLNVGASMLFPASGNMGIQVGGEYTQKGAQDTAGNLTVRILIDYVEVPVLLRIGIPSESTASAHVVLGRAIGFKARCRAEAESGGSKVSADCSEMDENITSVDFGALAGFGVDVKTSGTVILSLDALYELGLKRLGETGAQDIKNRGFTVQAGVGFPWGG